MIGITVTHWSEIGRDTLEFYNFTHKTWGDVAVFWVATLVAMCWHETAHGHATKHYGGNVPAMGFLLIYLAPAFYTDTTEGMVTGSRYQRFIIAMAGSWSELYLCRLRHHHLVGQRSQHAGSQRGLRHDARHGHRRRISST